MSNHPNQEKPAPRPISGLWRHGRCGVVVLINTLLAPKLHQVAILCAAACFGLATPAVHAADTSAAAGIVSPVEPDEDSFDPGVSSAGQVSEDSALFKACQRHTTGATASM